MTIFFFCIDNCGFLDVGHPLWWEDGSVIYTYNCFWALPKQSFSGPSPGELMTIFYCLSWGSPNLGARLPYFYPPGTGWPSYTPGTGFPFLCLLRLARLRWRYSNPPPHEVEVNLRPTVSRPVCSDVRRPSGTCDQFFFLLEISFRQLRLCYFVAPSLTRGRVRNLLYNCFWALPEQSLLGQSPAELTTIFYSLIWDSPNLEPGSRIYIPQEHGGPVIPSGTGFPFCRLLRLAGQRWRYSNPPPHGAFLHRVRSSSCGRQSINQLFWVSGLPLGPLTRFYLALLFSSDNYFILLSKAPSLTRKGACSLQCNHSLFNNHTLPSHLRLCSLFVASYDSQGLRWKYSNPPPHGDLHTELSSCGRQSVDQ
jgi:hypothetical protein